MKGESTIWSVLMTAVGVSFVIVAVALGVVSKRSSEMGAASAPDARITAVADLASTTADLKDAGPQDTALIADAGPSDGSTAEILTDASPDDGSAPELLADAASLDAGSPNAATTTPHPLPLKASPSKPKPITKPKPKKRR